VTGVIFSRVQAMVKNKITHVRYFIKYYFGVYDRIAPLKTTKTRQHLKKNKNRGEMPSSGGFFQHAHWSIHVIFRLT